jgi:hypothetical protein
MEQEHFQEVTALQVSQRDQPPVVDRQDVGAGQFTEQPV